MSDFEGIAGLLRAVMSSPAEAGPPWTHVYRPEWEWDEDGALLPVKVGPSFSLVEGPAFTGVLAFLGDAERRQELRDAGWSGWLLDLDDPVRVAPPARSRSGKKRRRR